jgi:hypothetical protein
MCSGWSRHTKGRWQHRPGVDALGPDGGRDNAGEAQERRTRRLVQVERRRTEGDAKFMEDALGVSMHAPGESGTERPRGPLRRRTRSRGEQRSSSELLLRPTGCGPTVRESGVSVPSLEGQANITSAGVAASVETNGFRTLNL